MDDNDKEGDYNADFYASPQEGDEEPPLPRFRNFSFQAAPAIGPGSSTGQQPIQADGTPQDPEPEPDDVNDDTGPVGGGDEDLNEEEGEEEEGEEEKHEDDDEDEEEEEEEEEEAEVASGAQDGDVGQIVQEWRNNVMRDAQQQGAGQGQQPTTAVLLQYAASHPAYSERERRRQLRAARTIAERNDQHGRVSLWLENSPHIQGPAPQQYAQQAMSDTAWKQRYGRMTAAQRLAHDIPVPRGQPPVNQRTKRRYWRKLDLVSKGKRKVNDDDDDDDSDYESVDENSDQYRSYIPEQAYLTRNNLPFLMGVREVEHHKHPPGDPTRVPLLYDQNGQPVLGFQRKHLRDLPILPRRIPAGVPGWLVEVWMRYDKRIAVADLQARIHKSVGRVTKRGTDYREQTAGLFHAYKRDNKFEEKEPGRGKDKDVIDAIKSDCQAADIVDPLGDSSETDAQKRERTDNAAQKIFRNTVWNLTRDHNGAVNGIQQPGGASDHHFPLPPIVDPEAGRMRAGCAKRNQLLTNSRIRQADDKWEAFAGRDPMTWWRLSRTGRENPADGSSDDGGDDSTPAAGPSTRGRGRGRGGRGRGGGAAAPTRGGSASARGRGGGANTQTTDLRRSKRNKQAETAAEPSSTTPSPAPKEDNICFRFFENEPLDRLELQALALLRMRAVHPLPGWVDTQLDQLRQGQRGTGAEEQEEENRLGPTQIFDTVEEAVRTARHAISSDLFRNSLWREQHRILQTDPDSNRVLVFRSAIILLIILRDQTGDSTITNAFDPNDQALTAMYGGDDSEGIRDEFVTRVRRDVDEHWRGFFPHDPQFAPGLVSPSNGAGATRRSSATGSQGQQEGPSPNQPDDEDDDGDDDDDEDDDYPDDSFNVAEELDREDAEKKQKQQHTQNTAPQNLEPNPSTTNNQPGPSQQHGQEDTTAKPSTGDTPPRRSSRRASAAATAAIQQQTTPTRRARSIQQQQQQQQVPDSLIDPRLATLGFEVPQPSPGGGPMSPPQRPTHINTSPRTPNGRQQAPVNVPHALSPRRSPRLQRTSQGSAQQQPQLPVEARPAVNTGGWGDDAVYPGDDVYYGPASKSPNTAGEFMDQLTQENGRTVYATPPSARNPRTNPYFTSPPYGPHGQQQHHAPFIPYGHNDNDPLNAHPYDQGQPWGYQLNQPHISPQRSRNSLEINQQIETDVARWNRQYDEEREQREQKEEADQARADIHRFQQRGQDQRQLQPQQPLVAHAPPVLPSAQQPTAQALSGAPVEATAPTAQTVSGQAPPQAPEPEPEPQPKPAAKKTGGGAKGKKRKASADPPDDSNYISTTQQQPATRTTVTTRATKMTAPPPQRKKKAAQPTTRQTRAQRAATAEAAAPGDGGGDAGDDKEADDAKATTTTTRAPVKRKRGGGGAAKAPPSRLQKTRNAVKGGRVSGLHKVYDDPQKRNGGKESTQPGKKRKVMGAEKEEDDDMRDRDDDDDDGDSDYTED